MRWVVAACVVGVAEGVTAEKCSEAVFPKERGNADGLYTDGDNTAPVACPAAKPAFFQDDGNEPADDEDGTVAEGACCAEAVKCSSTYEDPDGEDADLVNCPAGTKVQKNNDCFTVAALAGTQCGVKDGAAATLTGDVDKKQCCREPCKHDDGGFELFEGGDDNKKDCPEGSFYKVSETAVCASDSCATSDKSTCCLKKCSTGVVLNGGTIEGDVDVECKSETATHISTTAYCKGSTCDQDDTQCCQQKCGDVVELFSDTATEGYAQCPDVTDLKINADAKTGLTEKDKYSKSSDEETCCLTKCTAEKGFELFVATGGTKTEGKFQCPKDLRVHPDGHCKTMDCSKSSAVCCQQKCTAGFKLKGATGTGTECDKDLTVHATAYCSGSSCGKDDAKTCCQQKCGKGWKLNGAKTTEANTCAKDTTLAADAKCKGSPCGADDAKTCCNVKCNDKKTGFKVKGTKDATLECKAQETVSSKGMCKGDCSEDDAKSCCLKANSTTATTDATSVGMAAGVGMLVLLSSVS